MYFNRLLKFTHLGAAGAGYNVDMLLNVNYKLNRLSYERNLTSKFIANHDS